MIGRAPQVNDPGKLIEDDVPTLRPELAPSVQADALSALSNLGYAPGDAAAAVVKVLDAQPGADTSALIRASLKILAPKNL
jgi:Holliday junction DNA helicase RuvA